MKLKVKDEFASRSSKCPTCKHLLVVPAPDKTQADVVAGQIDGTDSSLAKAGVDGGVILEQAARPSQKPLHELLARRTRKDGRYIIASSGNCLPGNKVADPSQRRDLEQMRTIGARTNHMTDTCRQG